MDILDKNSKLPQNCSLILGFFDGVHAGHINVINNTPKHPKVLVTFSSSPSEYFKKNTNYIYSRDYNYKLINSLGVDIIYEQIFENIVNMSANTYLDTLVSKFKPYSITTGFNHTFGSNRQGTTDMLKNSIKDFEYFCTPPTEIDGEIVSSTYIKELLSCGNIEKATKYLTRNFSITSKVIEGAKLGTRLGYPTANLEYPQNIVKIPYGVYKVKVFGKPAVMNWGIKPTIGSKEIIEVHIPNYYSNLYGKNLEIEILSKIRDEKKFKSLEDLKLQIERDVEECLK